MILDKHLERLNGPSSYRNDLFILYEQRDCVVVICDKDLYKLKKPLNSRNTSTHIEGEKLLKFAKEHPVEYARWLFLKTLIY